MSCPSEIGLEAYLLAPDRSSIREHVRNCPACAATLAQMEAEGEAFHARVFPETVHHVERAARSARRVRLGAAVAVPLLAAAAAVLLVVRTGAPPQDYVGAKGAALGLRVFAADGDGTRAVDDGAPVAATAGLRFSVSPARPCHLWIVSVDSRAAVSRLFPAEGDGGQLVSTPTTLPGGAVLDGEAGWERLYAVCTPQPLAYASVEQSVREAAANARTQSTLPDLGTDTLQASVLLEKQP